MRSRFLIAAVVLAATLRPVNGYGQADTASAPGATPDHTFQSAGKFLHFLAGMSLGMLGAGLAEYALEPTYPSQHPLELPSLAIAVALPAGIAKEVLDSTGFGDPRITDVLITTAGGLAAALIVGYAESFYPPDGSGKANSVALLISTSALLAVPVAFGFAKEVRNTIERHRTLAP